jgi:hypothetical protein
MNKSGLKTLVHPHPISPSESGITSDIQTIFEWSVKHSLCYTKRKHGGIQNKTFHGRKKNNKKQNYTGIFVKERQVGKWKADSAEMAATQLHVSELWVILVVLDEISYHKKHFSWPWCFHFICSITFYISLFFINLQ